MTSMVEVAREDRAVEWLLDSKNPAVRYWTLKDVQRLLGDSGIIRNRLKIEATITNAKQCLATRREFGSFDKYLWRHVDGRPIKHKFNSLSQIPPTTRESNAMSKELREKGFMFVGPTICYAFMQAVGMVNDHTTKCFRYGMV